MALLRNMRIERSAGPTLLSRRPVARVSGTLAEPARLARLWPQLLPALEDALAAVGVQDLPFGGEEDAAAGPEALASLPRQIAEQDAMAEVGRLLAATAVALKAASRAPRGAWGIVDPGATQFLAYLDDWMHGVGPAALDGAIRLVEAAAAAKGDKLEDAAKAALAKVREARVEGFAYPLVRAAEARGLPWRLLSTNDLVIVYGQGRRQRWARATLLDSQSCASVHISLRKDIASRLLQNAGFPMPEHRTPTSRARAEAAARELGFPLVVKPVAGTRAEDVHLGLTSVEQVGAAYDACAEEGTPVMLERYAEGDPYRITVIGGRAVAAGRHSLPFVTGDGVSTVEQLIAAGDARARLPVPDGYARYFPFDREFYAAEMAQRLEAQGLTPDSVPEAGREVLLGYLPKRDRGGLYVDVTQRIHPGLMRLAEEVAVVVGSPTLGVDIIATDIEKAPGEATLVINEVNASPSPRAHEQTERPRSVAGLALDELFPDGDQGRIPIAAFYGAADASALDALESLLAAAGLTPGAADSDSARIGGYALRPRTGRNAHPGAAVLRDRRPDAAVFALRDADLTRRGVPSDRLDVVALPGSAAGGSTGRAAMRCLAGLPGQLLLTPLGVESGVLRATCPHRRWIAVAGGEADGAAVEAALAAGAEVALCEDAGGGRLRALLLSAARRDTLADAVAPPRAAAELWALAALLGLGFAPGAIRRIAWDREARHGVPA